MAEETQTLHVQLTTGGRFEVHMHPHSSVHTLQSTIAKRLRLPKEKIVLLHRNKQLTKGSLSENNILDGSKLTLLPSVETGTAGPNAERCVMQALETLDDGQVDSFLAGRTPLNLSMRFGDHMMFVQLQLSTVGAEEGLLTPPTTPDCSPPPSPTERSSSSGLLCEASRHLTHTLRHLSSSSFEEKMNETCDGRCSVARKKGGAVIESMFHHGRGVFSGTFTGTLSPFLQDRDGRPRRNICTIVHILNDLLGASSHCNPCTTRDPPRNEARSDPPPSPQSPEEDALRDKMHHIRARLREKRRLRRGTPYPPHDESETAVA